MQDHLFPPRQAKDNGPLPPPGDGAGGAPSDADIAASPLLASAVSRTPQGHYREDVSQNKDGSAVANRELFLDVVDTRSKWEDMQCAVNLLLPVSDALQFIEGNSTRVSFVYLIMLHIGNDVAQWTSGALDGIFGKFCNDVELAQCVNEFMKLHNGDGGYGMMKDFAEQTHQQEFARLKEKYLRDHNLGKLPHCVSEAIMYCQAAMSNDEEMVGMIEDMLLQEIAAMDAAAASSNVTGNATNHEGDIGDAALANADEGAG
eukprot:jgi/Tetstr1/430581/TSEL_020378.t1